LKKKVGLNKSLWGGGFQFLAQGLEALLIHYLTFEWLTGNRGRERDRRRKLF